MGRTMRSSPTHHRISLHLLGGATLEGPSGRRPRGRGGHRRRLALLALVRASPLSRERLTAYLWPGADGSHGRHLLCHSLCLLRRELDCDPVLVAGDALKLNAMVVQADVTVFEEAVQSGDLHRAATAYAGPFLDGFGLDGQSSSSVGRMPSGLGSPTSVNARWGLGPRRRKPRGVVAADAGVPTS